MEKDIEIQVHDSYGDDCLGDSINSRAKGDRRPQGFVKIFEIDDDGNKQLVGKNNLVVYYGRETLAQRLVNLNNSQVSQTKDEFLTWFGLGDGGVDPSDPFDPIAPVISDDELSSRVSFNSIDASNADYHVVSAGYPTEGYYKKPFDSVVFEADTYNENRWLILKITVTLTVNDANGEQLSEAGLYTAESAAGGYSGQFSLFARVTFPTIVKDSSRRIVFVWYLYV